MHLKLAWLWPFCETRTSQQSTYIDSWNPHSHTTIHHLPKRSTPGMAEKNQPKCASMRDNCLLACFLITDHCIWPSWSHWYAGCSTLFFQGCTRKGSCRVDVLVSRHPTGKSNMMKVSIIVYSSAGPCDGFVSWSPPFQLPQSLSVETFAGVHGTLRHTICNDKWYKQLSMRWSQLPFLPFYPTATAVYQHQQRQRRGVLLAILRCQSLLLLQLLITPWILWRPSGI